jgi:hypothetical protein
MNTWEDLNAHKAITGKIKRNWFLQDYGQAYVL